MLPDHPLATHYKVWLGWLVLFTANRCPDKLKQGVYRWFPMSIERPTSGGQIRDQEAAVQRTFHLEKLFLSFGTNGKDSM